MFPDVFLQNVLVDDYKYIQYMYVHVVTGQGKIGRISCLSHKLDP